jgi:hypothetical protein
LEKEDFRDIRDFLFGRALPQVENCEFADGVVRNFATQEFKQELRAIVNGARWNSQEKETFIAAVVWRALRDSTDADALENFAREFSGTPHAEEARERAKEMRPKPIPPAPLENPGVKSLA